MACQQFAALLWLYAADACEPAERTRIEAHLTEGCRDCERELTRACDGLATLLLTAEPTKPSAEVKQNLLARVAEHQCTVPEAQHSPQHTAARLRLVGTAAAGIAAIVLFAALARVEPTDPDPASPAATNVNAEHHEEARLTAIKKSRDQWQQRARRLEQQLAATQSELGIAKNMLADVTEAHQRSRTLLALLGSPEASIIPLRANSSAEAWGRLIWDSARRQGLVFIAGLDPEQPDNRYTLRVTTDSGRSFAVRSFQLDEAQRGRFTFQLPESLASVNTIARASVSLEPADNAAAPATPMLSGNFPATTDEP